MTEKSELSNNVSNGLTSDSSSHLRDVKKWSPPREFRGMDSNPIAKTITAAQTRDETGDVCKGTRDETGDVCKGSTRRSLTTDCIPTKLSANFPVLQDNERNCISSGGLPSEQLESLKSQASMKSWSCSEGINELSLGNREMRKQIMGRESGQRKSIFNSGHHNRQSQLFKQHNFCSSIDLSTSFIPYGSLPIKCAVGQRKFNGYSPQVPTLNSSNFLSSASKPRTLYPSLDTDSTVESLPLMSGVGNSNKHERSCQLSNEVCRTSNTSQLPSLGEHTHGFHKPTSQTASKNLMQYSDMQAKHSLKNERRSISVDDCSFAGIASVHGEISSKINARRYPDHKNTKCYLSGQGNHKNGCDSSLSKSIANLKKHSVHSSNVLLQSISCSRVRHVQLLLQAGMSPDKKDDNGTPALSLALRLPDASVALRMVEELLKHGADVNARDDDGNTPLMLSCMMSSAAHAPVLTALLRHCPFKRVLKMPCMVLEIQRTNPKQLYMPDMCPFKLSGSSIVLLPEVSLNARNCIGRTALMVAAVHGNKDAIALLLAAFRTLHHHQQFGEVDSSGCSARQLAERHNRTSIAALLALEEEHSRPRANGFRYPPPSPQSLDRSPTPPQELLAYDTSQLRSIPSFSTSSTSTREKIVTSKASLNAINVSSTPQRDLQSEVSTVDCEVSSSSSPPSSSSQEQFQNPIEDTSMEIDLVADSPCTGEMNFSLRKSSADKIQALNSRASQSLEQPYPDSRKLRKQGIVTSISTGCLSNGSPTNDTMPKISVASRSLNKSIHQLLKDDLEGRPGHRPPTPARQSLPNLLPVNSKVSNCAPSSSNASDFNYSSHENSTHSRGVVDASRGAYVDMRRVTTSGAPRSASPNFRKLRSLEAIDMDLGASTRSEGWNNSGSSGVVPLPPINKGNPDHEHQESKLSLAKKTLEKLDNVLSFDDSLGYFRSHARSSVHTHT
ncbi:Ankyrin repeat-containing domain [Trinorchestia longiramus]|nr:Ankyrin repeat-containing domain [Trinorchestia longiramus]